MALSQRKPIGDETGSQSTSEFMWKGVIFTNTSRRKRTRAALSDPAMTTCLYRTTQASHFVGEGQVEVLLEDRRGPIGLFDTTRTHSWR